jgi:hypothetical protein
VSLGVELIAKSSIVEIGLQARSIVPRPNSALLAGKAEYNNGTKGLHIVDELSGGSFVGLIASCGFIIISVIVAKVVIVNRIVADIPTKAGVIAPASFVPPEEGGAGAWTAAVPPSVGKFKLVVPLGVF